MLNVSLYCRTNLYCILILLLDRPIVSKHAMKTFKIYILFLTLSFFSNLAFSQMPALICEDAEILCSLDELDGFTQTMPSNAENPFDGLPENPVNFCAGPGGNGSGNPQNMSWFGFIAGGPSAVVEIEFSNCSGGLNGVQFGIYTDCTFSEFLSGACQGTGVSANQNHILNLNGMVAGDNYYFFIDGDNGTICDYQINVLQGGGPVPVPQPTEILCTSGNCPPDGNICSTGETFTFEPAGLDLSIDYIWTVSPNPPMGQTIVGDNSISLTFNNTGTYDICMTATNGCTTTEEECYTLNVLEADAGMLDADPEVLCPGSTSTVSVTGYIDSPPISQALIAVGPDNIVIDVITGDMMDVTYPTCGVVTVYSYNFNPADSPPLPSVGDVYSEPGCNSSCCDTESIEVSFEDDEPPTLLDPPVDITIECDDIIPNLEDIGWTDNCDGAGVVAGVQMDNYNTCDGGTITRTWEYIDGCMNGVHYIQTITINSQMEGFFSSEPADEVYDCTGDIPPPMDLIWNGACEGMTNVTPLDSPEPDLCTGGTMTRTWSYNDPCGSFTEYVQTFTINAASGGDFVDPPESITVQCDLSDLPLIPTLEWMGDCAGTAMVMGTENIDIESCSGGSVTRMWTYTDPCGATANHTQTITVSPPPAPLPVNPPPANVVLDCDEVPTTIPDLDFNNGQTGDCAIMGTATPEIMGDPGTCGGTMSVIWIFTDDCFIPHSYVQNIIISPVAPPAFIDPPADMTISCLESIPTFPDLDYTNGETGTCEVSGTESASSNIDGDICGGDIVGIWQIPDPCNPGDFIEHIQTITIEPITEAMWVDPPPETLTLQCSDEIPPAIDLAYTNSESGTCEIMGTVPAMTMGTSDVCGGEITYNWEFTDDCGRTLEHQQIITIEPAPEPAFTDTPADVTIGCDEIPPTPPSLDYTNQETGICSISGSQAPTVDDNSNSCGGSITYTWEFTDPCGRDIAYMQTVTITEAPIVEFINPPAPITVDCNNIPAAAGPLSYTNNDACELSGSVTPLIENNYDICGGTIDNTWSFTDECGRLLEYTQTITVEPTPVAAFIDIPANTTVACGADATNPGNLSYTNGESGGCLISGEVAPTQTGSYTACGGNIQFTWDFTDECNRPIQAVQTIVVDPAPAAEFINLPPADITVACANFETTPPSLSYTNNETGLCLISGSVQGVILENTNPCGTTVQYRWEFSDDCGRNISYTQNVTIEEAAAATFTNPPPPQTVDCDDVASTVPSLSYTNGAAGICAISGSVPGIQSGAIDECGGNITYSWSFTDVCNRTITHEQVITVNPASDPTFIDPPADVTLGCGEDFPIDPPLDYTNGEGGTCAIAGSVTSTSMISGNVTTYTWSFINDCNGQEIQHIQNITGVPTPDISINPIQTTICLGASFDLSTIDVTDANGNSFTLSYENGGSPITNTDVSPTGTTIYTIIASNAAGCTDEATFTINVDDPPFAGIAAGGQVCSQGGLSYNLFDYLVGSFTPGGTWFDTDGSGANIDNPIMATFNGVAPGFYTFTYTVFSTNSCPDAEVEVEIEVISELEFEIFSIQCDPGGATYSINVISNGNSIFSNPGDVTVVDANNAVINNIPAGQNAIVSAIDANAFCISDQFVSAPDCDCPTVDSPISNGDFIICEGDPIPELSVTISGGLMANWYPDQTSTTALIENSSVYTPDDTAPGIYNYYVEAEDNDGCVSLIRTIVTLTINASPSANLITHPICEDNSGNGNIDLQILNSLINTNASFTYEYYPTLMDAEDQTNILDNIYTITASGSIYVAVTNSSGCTTIVEVQLSLSPQPTYNLDINNEVCIDSMDGSIIITDINPSGTLFSLDNIDFTAVNTFDNLATGSYTLYAQSVDGCLSESVFNIEAGLQISYTNLVLTCDSNGTDSDSSDDFYDITFTTSNNIGATGNINVESTTTDFGNFSYGDIAIEIPAGVSQTITITDLDTGCSIEFITGDLSPCSTNCAVTLEPLDIFCNGNGTDSDPSDDVYEITINASSINGASNNTFNVSVGGAIVANFQYGIGGTITIPAQGQTVVISAIDNADDQCFASQSIGPLNACSNECILFIDNQNFSCDNGGTAGVPGDDIWTFSFTVLATNSTSATFDLFVDNVNVGTFNYGEFSEYEFTADGMSHDIEFVDSSDDSCTISLQSPVLNPCSGDCSINIIPQEAICQNQNTGTDPSDDTYIADIFINVVGGSDMWTIVETAQTGMNGTSVTVGPFLISDGDVILEIQDAANSNCTQTITIEAPSTCSSCDDTVEAGVDQFLDCDITEVSLIGMPSTPTVGTWVGPGVFSENMNEVIVTVPGTYFFSVDFGEGCILTDSLEVVLTSLTLISEDFMCDNGGTIGVPEDDTYTFEFNVTSTNPSSTMYNLWIDGSIVGTYAYGVDSEFELPADDSVITLEIIDVDNATCVIEVISPSLENCSGECSISANESDIACDDENTADDSSDDTWSGEITINQTGGSGSWTIVETSQTGNPGETVAIGPFLISDGDVTYTINDSNISGCGTTITISPPPACSDCNESVEAGADWILDCTTVEAMLVGIPSIANLGTWTGPGGFSFAGNEVSITIPGTYYFTSDFGNNCIRTDSVIVSVSNDVPSASGGDDQSLTCLVDSVDLVGTVSGGSGNFTYQWLDANMMEISTETMIKVGEAGNYFFVVYDIDSDCTSPPSLVEVLDETADLDPQINANPSFIFDCQVDEITLQVVEEPNVEYRWFVGTVLITGASTSLTIVDPGTFRLEARHLITGCMGEKELVIEDQIQYPIPFIQPAELLDCNNGSVNLDGSSSQQGDNITYTWLDADSMIVASGVDNIDITQGGTYYLQLIDINNNCINFDTMFVNSNIDLPQVSLDDEATINCNESDILVSLITALDPASLSISWNTSDGVILSGENTVDISVGSQGLYTVSVLNPDNNCETIDSILISLPPQIETSLYDINDESCQESNNGGITITEVVGGSDPYSYFIDDMELEDNTLENLSEGTYDLLIVDNNGCEFNDQFNINVQDPFEILLLSEITVVQGQTTQLTASVNLSESEIESITWSPATNLSCPTCLVTDVEGGIEDITYTVGVTDINGCYGEAMILVRSNEEIVITVPNIFKPNDQGTSNANFTIYTSIDATINKLQVFDRWGNMVFINQNFDTNNPSLGWDGKFGENFVEQGVFVYYAEILIGDELIIKKGDVTVLR